MNSGLYFITASVNLKSSITNRLRINNMPTFIRYLLCMTSLLHTGTILSDNNDEPETATTIKYINGQIAVNLTDQQLQLAAIRSIPLETTTLQQKIPASGQVVDINPLFQQHARLQTLGVQISSARHEVQVATTAYQRASKLAAEGIYSSYKIQQLKHGLLQQQSELKSLTLEKQNLLSVIRHQWGQVLADDLMNNQELVTHLINSQHSLLLVTVPDSFTGSKALQTMTIDTDNQHQADQQTEYVSPSPFNTTVNGTNYFYIVHASLPVNRRIKTWLTIEQTGTPGVWIPDTAIIWLNNRPWVYVQLDNNLFQRRMIDSEHKHNQQWFVSHGFNAGDRIVVTGAATLLSEELRSQIPEEDDD